MSIVIFSLLINYLNNDNIKIIAKMQKQTDAATSQNPQAKVAAAV
jgi:hypothetical protein